MMLFCKKHVDNPVKGYTNCPSCEIEYERKRCNELQTQIDKLKVDLEATKICTKTATQSEDTASMPKTGDTMSETRLLGKLNDIINAIDDYEDLAEAASYLIGTKVRYLENGEFFVPDKD